jgi:hypothetical protein
MKALDGFLFVGLRSLQGESGLLLSGMEWVGVRNEEDEEAPGRAVQLQKPA